MTSRLSPRGAMSLPAFLVSRCQRGRELRTPGFAVSRVVGESQARSICFICFAYELHLFAFGF